MSLAERKRAAVAFHEAGHAVAAALLGVRVLRLVLTPTQPDVPTFSKTPATGRRIRLR